MRSALQTQRKREKGCEMAYDSACSCCCDQEQYKASLRVTGGASGGHVHPPHSPSRPTKLPRHVCADRRQDVARRHNSRQQRSKGLREEPRGEGEGRRIEAELREGRPRGKGGGGKGKGISRAYGNNTNTHTHTHTPLAHAHKHALTTSTSTSSQPPSPPPRPHPSHMATDAHVLCPLPRPSWQCARPQAVGGSGRRSSGMAPTLSALLKSEVGGRALPWS